MAKNEKRLEEKISAEIKKYGLLKESFLSIYKSEEKASKSRIENFDKINAIKETDNTLLSDIYKEFIIEMKKLEENRKQHLGKIMDLILPVTVTYPEILNKTRNKLKELIKLRNEKIKMEANKQKAKDKNDANEARQLNNEINRNKEEEKKIGEDLEYEIVKFESERVNDNKFLFLHYIHSELKYHAICLEKMSALFYRINAIDPRAELPEFIRKYNINIQLNSIGIKINEILDEQRKKQNIEQKKRDDIYGGAVDSGNNNVNVNINASNNGNVNNLENNSQIPNVEI